MPYIPEGAFGEIFRGRTFTSTSSIALAAVVLPGDVSHHAPSKWECDHCGRINPIEKSSCEGCAASQTARRER